jgi:HTH-type transcriptional regulator/antitoxin MqsA
VTLIKRRCPICDDGYLHDKIEYNYVEHVGVKGKIPIKYSVCDGCGSEIVHEYQLDDNKQTMINFRKAIDDQLLEERYTNC